MRVFTGADRWSYPDLGPDSTVVDGGMYEGDFAATIHRKYGCRIVGFEPVPEFFEQCYRRFAGHPKITVVNAALGDKIGTAYFGIKGCMSGLFCGDPNSHGESRLTTLDVEMGRLGIPSAELLKLNLEGSEFPVLEHAIANQYIRRFRHLQIQFHHVVPNWEDRYSLLQAQLSFSHEHIYGTPWVWDGYTLRP